MFGGINLLGVRLDSTYKRMEKRSYFSKVYSKLYCGIINSITLVDLYNFESKCILLL